MIIYEKDTLGRTVLEIVFQNAGSMYAEEGIAYFVSHLLNTKGTAAKKEKFYNTLEQDAISINTSVNKEFLTISLKFLNEKENKALNCLYDLLTSPNISEESFEKSKNEIKAKIQNKKNDNDYIASVNLYKSIFKNTPAAFPVMGENIDNITYDQIKNFYTSLFKKEHIIILGGKKPDIRNITGLFRPKKQPQLFFKAKKTDNIKTIKNVEQSYIHFASNFNTDYQKELHLAKIATFILGSGGFGSRMMEEIRVKRGYAYSAYTSNVFKKSYKLLSGYLQTKTENTDDSINIVKKLIDDFYSNGITHQELIQAKQFLIGSEPLRSETLNQRLLKKFNEYYLQLPENYYTKETELIKNTQLNEINEFIKKHPEIKDITFSIVTKE